MRFSKTADYALRVMVALANAGEERLSLHTLSKQEKVPRKFLEHVVRSLKSTELIESAPGPKGGYILTRPATQISVGQILVAVQGPFLPVDRLNPENVPDHLREPVERLHVVINDIRTFARQRLDSITLADMAEIKSVQPSTEELMYYI